VVDSDTTMMLSSFMARRSPATVAAVKTLVVPSLVAFPMDAAASTTTIINNQQQVRWVTKKRQHRQVKRTRKEELASKGIFPPKPHNFIPKDSAVLNAVSRGERDAESKRQDELAANELQAKMEIVKAPLLRFGFDPAELLMSDRVQKLFDLHNGNQKEVVRAQKQRGMELFQTREGDTGSSAVQGKLDLRWRLGALDSCLIVDAKLTIRRSFLFSVIALTTRIQQIQTHLRQHKKDKHSKRGLDALYVRRRKLLDYMEGKEFDSYRKVVKTLGLIH
jgi:small subunit ribosomal protein S15